MLEIQKLDGFELAVKDFMISSERVAHVQKGNNLEHALLVLTRSGYTAIPVLDHTFKLQGLISTPKIMDVIMGLERIEFEKLEEMKVEDVMNADLPCLDVNDPLEEALELLIDHPFICVIEDNGTFAGILTRRQVLKQVNRLVKKIKYN
ncbi:cyclic-di-AMP-binding protein CbpB [Pradoshia sp.]